VKTLALVGTGILPNQEESPNPAIEALLLWRSRVMSTDELQINPDRDQGSTQIAMYVVPLQMRTPPSVFRSLVAIFF
jgi:hypothetical protein